VQPRSSAKYVGLVTFLRPEKPRTARSQLAMALHRGLDDGLKLSTSLRCCHWPIRQRAAKQNGAPLRLVVPWKYGYKSIKSIVKIAFTDTQPATFWNTMAPEEYPFESNVDPNVPHPRWVPEHRDDDWTRDKHDTLLYNGYDEFVAHLYQK